MRKFILKKIKEKPIRKKQYFQHLENKSDKNNFEKDSKVMNTKEKIEMAKEVLKGKNEQPKYKTVRKDKGLIERTESSVTILTEDNKELLKD